MEEKQKEKEIEKAQENENETEMEVEASNSVKNRSSSKKKNKSSKRQKKKLREIEKEKEKGKEKEMEKEEGCSNNISSSSKMTDIPDVGTKAKQLREIEKDGFALLGEIEAPVSYIFKSDYDSLAGHPPMTWDVMCWVRFIRKMEEKQKDKEKAADNEEDCYDGIMQGCMTMQAHDLLQALSGGYSPYLSEWQREQYLEKEKDLDEQMQEITAYHRAIRAYHRPRCACGNESARGCDKCGKCCNGCPRHGWKEEASDHEDTD